MVANGVPVVIAENGLGLPVHPVEADAPLLKIAENGLGAPIVIVDDPKSPPFIIDGYSPTPPITLQSFELDSMSGNGGDFGYYHTIYGDINPEPLEGFTLIEFAWRSSSYLQIAFQGNVMEYVEGVSPVIDGVDIGEMTTPWAYDEGTDTTAANWTGGTGLADNTVYQVSWEIPG